MLPVVAIRLEIDLGADAADDPNDRSWLPEFVND